MFKAVSGLNLQVGRGELLGLVGESGSGKTTLGLSVIGLLPEPGRILQGDIRMTASRWSACPVTSGDGCAARRSA